MPGPVERWLETFMCKQYANVFQAFGFKTLQSVCQLQPAQLQAMGVAQEHHDKILENVHVLRQSLSLSGGMNYPDEMSGNVPYGSSGNGMAHPSHPSMGYPNPESNPMAMMNHYAAMQGYREQVQTPNMMNPSHYPNAQAMYRNQQQQQQVHQHNQQQFLSHQFNNMYNQNVNHSQDPLLMNNMGGGSNVFNRPSGPQTQGAGSPSVHPPPHPHLRQGVHPPNPQQVADNILQMASSTYCAQTVQVPLNKGRSAPYHNPRTNYNVQNSTGLPSNMSGIQGNLPGPQNMGNMPGMMPMMPGKSNMQSNSPRMMMQPAGSPSRPSRVGGQYGYPSSSPHPHQPRTSPISPMQMHSPASQHSNHSVHNNPSPGPLQSPVGGNINSPVSPMMSIGGMHSPCTKQTHMASPSPSQPMRSPIQQMKHINSPMMNCTPGSSPGHQMASGNLRSPQSHPSQHNSPHQPYYPHMQQSSQPSQIQFSPSSHCVNSPISHANSPPYVQSALSPSLSSPHSAVSKPSPSGSTSSLSYNVLHQPLGAQPKGSGQSNPLQSLQKLCMLPETQVVDPKSVVNEDCLSSLEPGTEAAPKNCDTSTDSTPSYGNQLEIKRSEGNQLHQSLLQTSQPMDSSFVAERKADTSAVSVKSPACESNSNNQKQTESSTELGKRASDMDESKGLSLSNSGEPDSSGQTSVKNYSDETSYHSANSNCDKLQGTGHVEVKRYKQENMSPKKRFLGSQPMLNGNKVDTPSTPNSVPDSEVISNGPIKAPKTDANDNSRITDISSSFNTNSVKGFDLSEHPITESYINKKFKKRSAMEKVSSICHSIAAVEGNGQGGPVTCAMPSVIQATPRFGATLYDDVSDVSDVENNEFLFRKDSVKTYTRGSICSSPLAKSFNHLTNHDSDDSEDVHHNDISIPFNDERFKDEKVAENETPLANYKVNSKIVQNSPKNDISNVSPTNSVLQNSDFQIKSSLCENSSEDEVVSPNRKVLKKKHIGTKRRGSPRGKPVENKVGNAPEQDPVLKGIKSPSKELPVEAESMPEQKEELPIEPAKEENKFLSSDEDSSPPSPLSPGEVSWEEIISSSSKLPAKTTGTKTNSDSKDSSEIVKHEQANVDKSINDHSPQNISLKSKSKNSSMKTFSSKARPNSLPVSDSESVPSVNESSKSAHQETSKKRSVKKSKTSVKDTDINPTSDDIEILEESTGTDNEDFQRDDSVLHRSSDLQLTPSSSQKVTPAQSSSHRKRRGRPPGSKNKAKKEKFSKRKRDVFEYFSEDEKKSLKSSKKSLPVTVSSLPPTKKRKDFPGISAGPFIRLEGSRDNPDKCVIMNAPLEDNETNKPVKKKKMSIPPSTTSGVKSIQISNLPSDRSVLVPGLSPSDETLWFCCICRKHSSYKFLGDLFGPYYPEGYQPAPSTAEDGSEKPKQRRKKMFVLADQVPNYAALMKPVRAKRLSGDKKQSLCSSFELESGAIADSDELWVHEDCALWSDGAYLIENNIYGLQEAANVAATTACSSCHEVGASIGCLNKGCSQKYHYVCAVEKDCYLDEENFSLLCLKHKEKRLKTTDQASRKVS